MKLKFAYKLFALLSFICGSYAHGQNALPTVIFKGTSSGMTHLCKELDIEDREALIVKLTNRDAFSAKVVSYVVFGADGSVNKIHYDKETALLARNVVIAPAKNSCSPTLYHT